MDYEQLRINYKPGKIRILLVGESRPAPTKEGIETFFYKKDSTLFVQTKKAFEEYLGTTMLDDDFLLYFKKYCWLYDVCKEPVNDLENSKRRAKVIAGIPDLKKLIDKENPEIIILIGKTKKYGTKKVVEEIRKTYITKNVVSLYFPSRGRDVEYRQGIVNI